MHIPQQKSAFIGCLLGTAIGDAFGLPLEGLSKNRQHRLYPRLNRYHLIFGKGMISDDTEHICMVSQSLIVSAGDTNKFTQAFAWRLRFWLLCLPVGIGSATLKACIKLLLGFSPTKSGVLSAGNGPCMRSAIIGVCYGNDIFKLRSLVKASTRITHKDIKAEWGALAVAIAAYLASTETYVSPKKYYETVTQVLGVEAAEFCELIRMACDSVQALETAALFATQLKINFGISGYVYHTVPIVVQVWLRYQENYVDAIEEIVRLGGDTDTTAAILGGIIGSAVGKSGIPENWLDNLWEYPRTVKWIESLGERLFEVSNSGKHQSALPLSIPGLLLRNLLFSLIVIGHGFRRLLPPY